MAKTLQQIFAQINSIGTIESVKSGLPRVFPDALYRVTKRVVGNVTTFSKTTGQRASANASQYGAPSKAVSGVDRNKVPVTLVHAAENITHDPSVLLNLTRVDNGEYQEMGIDELVRQVAAFKTRFDNLRTNAIASALAKQTIWFNDGGQILFSSSGATNTISYGSTTVAVSASWNTAATNIVGDITGFKRTALQTTGYPITTCIYGKNIPDYVGKNDAVKEFIKGSPVLSTQAYSGEIPNGLCGLNWVPGYQAFGLDTSGTATSWVGDNQVIFMPDVTTDWYDLVEGSVVDPTQLDGIAAGEIPSLSQRYGMFMYAKLANDPASIKHVGYDTFMPIIKNGAVILNEDSVLS